MYSLINVNFPFTFAHRYGRNGEFCVVVDIVNNGAVVDINVILCRLSGAKFMDTF